MKKIVAILLVSFGCLANEGYTNNNIHVYKESSDGVEINMSFSVEGDGYFIPASEEDETAQMAKVQLENERAIGLTIDLMSLAEYSKSECNEDIDYILGDSAFGLMFYMSKEDVLNKIEEKKIVLSKARYSCNDILNSAMEIIDAM
jgi:hypothetical protein